MSVTQLHPEVPAMNLVSRVAAVPGLVRPGVSTWDMTTRLPLHPLAVETAYGDPALLQAMGARGAAFAHARRHRQGQGSRGGLAPLLRLVR